MRTNRLARVPALVVCAAMLALIGCGGGSSSSSSTTTYTLGGTLAGLGSNQSVSLQDNGGDTLTVSANGAFSFPMSLDTGAAYDVTVQSHTPGIACSVTNGGGTVGSSDVTEIGVSCAAGAETVLYSFGASGTDGQNPLGGLVMDSAGNLYGTTENGGANGFGTAFKIDAAGTESILCSFGASATDGMGPFAGLVMDNAGNNLYGTTVGGGAHGGGTVFKIGTSGTETILHSFGINTTDGQNPAAGLVMDSAGNFYGTTEYGGANGLGTVFEISAAGTESVLYSFGASTTDGQNPEGGVVMDSAGNLYGTTLFGGANGGGTVFKIGASGMETILRSFGASATDGQSPDAGLIMDSAGNLYGTTGSGGVRGGGTVFMLSPGAGGTYTETILYSFGASATDGMDPYAGLIVDSAGNLYGTTRYGGANGLGTAFVID